MEIDTETKIVLVTGSAGRVGSAVDLFGLSAGIV
jgi:hypothetical protein